CESLDTLPMTSRRIFSMAQLDGMSNGEIAERSGSTPNAVQKSSARASGARLSRPHAPEAGKIDPKVIRQAADWWARSRDGATPADRDHFERWRQASPAHDLAWQRSVALTQGVSQGVQQAGAGVASRASQQAPSSVTAFSSQASEDARVKGVADFIGITPNISIVQSQSAGNSFVTIRGISQVRNGESPIAVVTDGIQQISARQFTSDSFDVKQIEVLRGPQGALYGRNAIGGAIIVTTKQPTNDFHLDAQISAGNGNDYRGEVSVSGPIVKDKSSFRSAGSARNFGGSSRNDYSNQTVDWVHDRNVRGQLKAFSTDTSTADSRASYSHTNAIG
ncbi:hypothetical protein OY671_007981, partial [Metschnikowia pulcherrima]